MVAGGEFTPNIEHERGRWGLAQAGGIDFIFLGDERESEFIHALQFAFQVDDALPLRDGFGEFAAKAFDLHDVATFGLEQALGAVEDLKQTTHAHGPDLGQKVQREVGFGASHGDHHDGNGHAMGKGDIAWMVGRVRRVRRV
jgi:hypothetical protein